MFVIFLTMFGIANMKKMENCKRSYDMRLLNLFLDSWFIGVICI